MVLRPLLQVMLAAALFAAWIVAIHGYGLLPESFPAHFGADGTPDRFMQKSWLGWFALPAIFTVFTALFGAVGWLLPRAAATHATFLNVPDKQAFLALPADSRMRVLGPMQDLSLMMPAALLALSAYIQTSTIEIALGRAQTLPTWPLAAVLLWSFAALAITVVRMQRAIREESASSAR